MSADAPPTVSARAATTRWQAWLEIALIFVVFLVHGGWAAPDSNEAHYLAKARHYWNPQWCENDFFLQSRDAHHVFYWTFGFLTQWLPLAAVAWIGRVLTFALMAWAFRRLSWSLTPRRWMAPLVATLTVFLNESNHMAGEWFVGGLEAKGFAYVLVFLGLEALVLARWNRCWILLGAASAFHVLVGGWAVVAAGVVWLCSSRGTRPKLLAMLPALLIGGLLTLPAILPSLRINAGVDAQTATEANRVYVYERLYHHLDLDKFEKGYAARHVTLGLVWLLLISVTPATAGQWRSRIFTAACIGIAICGYGCTVLMRYDPPLGYSLLRFYWFRMSDVFVPWGVASTGMCYIAWQFQTRPVIARRWLSAVVLLVAYDLGTQAWKVTRARPRADKNVQFEQWLEVCRWAEQNTPDDAVFLTPRNSATFKWRANRSEVVTWKDVPQDADHLVQWWQRQIDIHQRPIWTETYRWRESPYDGNFDHIRAMAARYHFQYVILESQPNIPLPTEPPLYRTKDAYAIYRVDAE